MAALSDYLENELLDHVLRNSAYTSPAIVYAALFTTATTDAGGGTEVSGGSYARTALTFGSAASAGSISNTADSTFPTATASWGTVSHMAIYDALTVGNSLFHGALTESKTVNNGDTFILPSGQVTVTLD